MLYTNGEHFYVQQNERPDIILTDKHASQLFWLCWGVYVAAYLGRLNYVAVMAEIIQSGHLSLTMAGFVATAFFASYGFGQLINGFINDRVSPKKMLFAGLLISAIANAAMGLFNYAWLMILIWGVNGFAQAMLWPAIVKILSSYLSQLRSVKALVNISTSVATGTFATYIATAGMLTVSSWRSVFFVAAVVMGVAAVAWYFCMGKLEKGIAPREHIAIRGKDEKPLPVSFPRLILVSGLPLAAIAVVLQGMLRDGVTTWTPTLINAQFNLGTSSAILITAFVPLVSIGGVYLSHVLNTKLVKNEVMTAAVLFGIATFAFVLLVAGGASNVVVLLLSLVIAISVMHGVNTMLISIVPLYFADIGRAASVTGAMNAFTYLGSGISTYAIGFITLGFGWGINLVSWIIIAGLGMIICLLCSNKWGKFKI